MLTCFPANGNRPALLFEITSMFCLCFMRRLIHFGPRCCALAFARHVLLVLAEYLAIKSENLFVTANKGAFLFLDALVRDWTLSTFCRVLAFALDTPWHISCTPSSSAFLPLGASHLTGRPTLHPDTRSNTRFNIVKRLCAIPGH